MTFAYATEALSADAKLWDDVSDKLTDLKSTVTGLDVYTGAFSFAGTEAAAAYAALQTAVSALLDDGSTITAGAATTLRQIRSDYENTELSIQQSLDGLWEPQTY